MTSYFIYQDAIWVKVLVSGDHAPGASYGSGSIVVS